MPFQVQFHDAVVVAVRYKYLTVLVDDILRVLQLGIPERAQAMAEIKEAGADQSLHAPVLEVDAADGAGFRIGDVQ